MNTALTEGEVEANKATLLLRPDGTSAVAEDIVVYGRTTLHAEADRERGQGVDERKETAKRAGAGPIR